MDEGALVATTSSLFTNIGGRDGRITYECTFCSSNIYGGLMGGGGVKGMWVLCYLVRFPCSPTPTDKIYTTKTRVASTNLQ